MTRATNDLAGLDRPLRDLFARIAGPAAEAVPDLPTIGDALRALAGDLDYVTRWVDAVGDTSGATAIHAPARGPRLMIVHRRDGEMSAVHDHGTWVAIAPIVGLETHRRWRLASPGEGDADLGTDDPVAGLQLAQADELQAGTVATLLPPDDLHDHGHLAGRGRPAHILILTGDDQRRYRRNEWDLATGRHRVLEVGQGGRWLATEPFPER